jgi:hypothetical protein
VSEAAIASMTLATLRLSVSGLSEVGGTDGSELRLAICLDPVVINSVSLNVAVSWKKTPPRRRRGDTWGRGSATSAKSAENRDLLLDNSVGDNHRLDIVGGSNRPLSAIRHKGIVTAIQHAYGHPTATFNWNAANFTETRHPRAGPAPVAGQRQRR